MKLTMRRRAAALAACAIAACGLVVGSEAHAQQASRGDLSRVLDLVRQHEERMSAQDRQLQEQERLIAEQAALIERQRRELAARAGPAAMPGATARSAPAAHDEPLAVNRRTLLIPIATRQARAQEEPQVSPVEALRDRQSGTLARGGLIVENTLEYARNSSSRFVFRGAEIAEQIGPLDAGGTGRDVAVASLALRYGLTDRLEIEGRLPVVYRSQNGAGLAREGGDIGDAEVSARYRLSRGGNGAPVLVAGARVKSDSGNGPFDIERDAQGAATELATGSGFWGVEGSLSVLNPGDQGALYASASYLYNVPRHVDRVLGGVAVGKVDPGDSIAASVGMGFVIDPRLSLSLGYSHTLLLPTESELDGAVERSPELHAGAVQLGLSLQASERVTVALGVDVGVTAAAPDVRVSLRTPFRW